MSLAIAQLHSRIHAESNNKPYKKLSKYFFHPSDSSSVYRERLELCNRLGQLTFGEYSCLQSKNRHFLDKIVWLAHCHSKHLAEEAAQDPVFGKNRILRTNGKVLSVLYMEQQSSSKPGITANLNEYVRGKFDLDKKLAFLYLISSLIDSIQNHHKLKYTPQKAYQTLQAIFDSGLLTGIRSNWINLLQLTLQNLSSEEILDKERLTALSKSYMDGNLKESFRQLSALSRSCKEKLFYYTWDLVCNPHEKQINNVGSRKVYEDISLIIRPTLEKQKEIFHILLQQNNISEYVSKGDFEYFCNFFYHLNAKESLQAILNNLSSEQMAWLYDWGITIQNPIQTDYRKIKDTITCLESQKNSLKKSLFSNVRVINPQVHTTQARLPHFILNNDFRSYRYLGAHIESDKVHFKLLAPSAAQVHLIKTFSLHKINTYKMSRDAEGVWHLESHDFKINDTYHYEIHTYDGEVQEKVDPYSFDIFNYVVKDRKWGFESMVSHKLSSFEWSDYQWVEQRKHFIPSASPLNIYEIHLPSWIKNKEGKIINYRELAEPLATYCKKMSYTHVEMMALLDYFHEGRSWGYQPNTFFSPNSRLGNKMEFQYLINYLHNNNIGVILDWIPNHFSSHDRGFKWLDGTYFYEKGLEHQYGCEVFDYNKPQTRDFLISSINYWIEEMHIDGIRVDSVENIAKRNGMDQLLDQANKIVHQRYPGVFMIAEDTSGAHKITNFCSENGAKFDFKWKFAHHGTLFHLLRQDRTSSTFYAGANKDFQKSLIHSVEDSPHDNNILAFSHDEPYDHEPHDNLNIPRIIAGNDFQKFAQLRLLFSLTMTLPGKKLNFMGNEFGQQDSWDFRLARYQDHSIGELSQFCKQSAVEWEALNRPLNSHLHRMNQAINKLYLENSALWELEGKPLKGFAWVSCDDSQNNVISFLRKDSKQHQLLCIANFSHINFKEYKIKVNFTITILNEKFNSDKLDFGGNGFISAAIPQIQPGSITVRLPALSLLVFDTK
jgi:1,4-alpha-glucan branching enzyme